MRVRKRCGELATVEFDKILRRLKTLGSTDIKINYTALTMKVIDQLFDGISTTKIDELSAEQCASMASLHHDYNTLAGRIVVSNHLQRYLPRSLLAPISKLCSPLHLVPTAAVQPIRMRFWPQLCAL